MSDFAKDTNTMDASWQLYDAERIANERLRQQLENMTERYNVRKELADHLSQQLAAANAEIERLKADCNYVGESNERLGARVIEAEKTAAASQLREQQLRVALYGAHKALDAIGDEMTVGDRYTNAGQYLLDSLEPSRKALALPADTSALEALIAKAGEVMRERCAAKCPSTKTCYTSARDEIESEIRALPGVTTEDLK